MARSPILDLDTATLDRYAVEMASVATQACREGRPEEGITERIADRLNQSVFHRGPLRAWVAETLNKYVEEGPNGADLAILMVGSGQTGAPNNSPRIVKAVFIQAKLSSHLKSTKATCELYRQCEVLNRKQGNAGWAWLYDEDGPWSIRAGHVVQLIRNLANGSPCREPASDNPWRSRPWIAMRDRQTPLRGHPPATWFRDLLRCNVGSRKIDTDVIHSLRRLRPTIVAVLARRDQETGRLEELIGETYRARE